jgi:hypothetical protein
LDSDGGQKGRFAEDYLHRQCEPVTAMKAGIADHIWSVEEVVALLDTSEREKVA